MRYRDALNIEAVFELIKARNRPKCWFSITPCSTMHPHSGCLDAVIYYVSRVFRRISQLVHKQGHDIGVCSSFPDLHDALKKLQLNDVPLPYGPLRRFHNIYGPFTTWKGGREKAPAAF